MTEAKKGKIVIVGAGEVGRSVAKTLTEENYSICLVEKNEARASSVKSELDIQVVIGNGSRPQVLSQTGLNHEGEVHMLIACTNRDEANILSCWIAHNAGVKYVISRVKNLEFSDSPDLGRKLGVEFMLSPERSIAREVIGLLEVSSATHAAELLDGRAGLYTLRISPDSPLVDTALKDVRAKLPELTAVFVHVSHADGTAGVPNGFTVLKEGDVCHVVTYKQTASILQEAFNPQKGNRRALRKIFVVGGGKLGTQIVQAVKRDFGNASIRLIEQDEDKSRRLSEELGEALVINADGADRKVLTEEGIENADAYICATDSDELNLIYCTLAKQMGAKKTIAVVTRKDYQTLTQSMPVDAIVDPNEALANMILRVVHYPRHTLAFSMIENIDAEMLEIVLHEGVSLTGKILAQIKLQKGVVVALLGRGDKVLVPDGNTQLLAGDRVILFALTSMMPQAAELFGAELGADNED